MTNETHQQLHTVKRGPYYSEAAAEAREIVATMVAEEEEATHEDFADDSDFEDYYGPAPFDDLPEMDIIIANCWES